MRTEPAGMGGSVAARAGDTWKKEMTRNRKLSTDLIWPLQALALDVMVALHSVVVGMRQRFGCSHGGTPLLHSCADTPNRRRVAVSRQTMVETGNPGEPPPSYLFSKFVETKGLSCRCGCV